MPKRHNFLSFELSISSFSPWNICTYPWHSGSWASLLCRFPVTFSLPVDISGNPCVRPWAVQSFFSSILLYVPHIFFQTSHGTCSSGTQLFYETWAEHPEVLYHGNITSLCILCPPPKHVMLTVSRATSLLHLVSNPLCLAFFVLFCFQEVHRNIWTPLNL